jgi:hypothetical protein
MVFEDPFPGIQKRGNASTFNPSIVLIQRQFSASGINRLNVLAW